MTAAHWVVVAHTYVWSWAHSTLISCVNYLRFLVKSKDSGKVERTRLSTPAFELGRALANSAVGSLEDAGVLLLLLLQLLALMPSFQFWIDVIRKHLYFLIASTEKFYSLPLISKHLLRCWLALHIRRGLGVQHVVVRLGLELAIIWIGALDGHLWWALGVRMYCFFLFLLNWW